MGIIMVISWLFSGNYSKKPNYNFPITPEEKAVNQAVNVYSDNNDPKIYIEKLEKLEKEKVKEAELYLSFLGKNGSHQPALDLYDEAIYYADMVQTNKKSLLISKVKPVEDKPKVKRASKVNKKTQLSTKTTYTSYRRIGPAENQDRVEYYYRKKAEIRFRNKDVSGAINEIDKAINKNPTIGLYDLRALLNMVKGDKKSACVDWGKAADLGANRTNLIKNFCNTCDETNVQKPEIEKPKSEIIDIHHELFYDAWDLDDYEANIRDIEDWNSYLDDLSHFR